jgi:hypothetical protein
MELSETKLQLLDSRICHQSDAQSRQILRRGLEVHQRVHLQLAKNYKSIYEECDQEKASLKEDLRIAEELIQSQKHLIELYQGPQQQQQPASHLVQGGPLLSQYNDHNHSRQYSPYQSSSNNDFIDPASLRPLNDFGYSIVFPAERSYDTEPAMSTPVAEFEYQTPNMSIQSVLHPISVEPSYDTEPVMSTSVTEFEYQTPNLSIQFPISAERDVPRPTDNKSEEPKRGLEDEGVRPSKKRKTK